MLTAIASTLFAVPVIAWITYAFKNPKRYKEIEWTLSSIFAGVVLLIGVWSLSSLTTEIFLISYIDREKYEEAKQAIDWLRPPFWTLIIAGPLWAFIGSLSSIVYFFYPDEKSPSHLD